MAEPGRIIFDKAAITAVLSGPQGMVARDHLKRTLKVEAAAKRLCPVDEGRLRSSIRHNMGRDARGLFGRVGTDVSYARAVHDGTRPHVIVPRNVRLLRFPTTRRGSTFVFAKRVNHPGTRPRPFLRDALRFAR